jgi:hypothetical protein
VNSGVKQTCGERDTEQIVSNGPEQVLAHDTGGLDSSGGPQSFFHMMLAGGTGHAQNRESQRFCRGGGYLLLQVCGVASLGQSVEGKGDRGRILWGTEAGCAHEHFLDLDSFGGGQSAAVHIVD